MISGLDMIFVPDHMRKWRLSPREWFSWFLHVGFVVLVTLVLFMSIYADEIVKVIAEVERTLIRAQHCDY